MKSQSGLPFFVLTTCAHGTLEFTATNNTLAWRDGFQCYDLQPHYVRDKLTECDIVLQNEEHYPQFPAADWNYSLLSYFHDMRSQRQSCRSSFIHCMLWFLMLTWVRLVSGRKNKLRAPVQVQDNKCMAVCVEGGWNRKAKWICMFTEQTCSCDPSGSPAARRQPSPGPGVRRSGSTWAVCLTGCPRRLARRTRSPSKSLAPLFLGGAVQTGRRPAGSLSPGSRWLQTFWQRRWAAQFAAEGGQQNGKAGRDEIRRRKKRRLRNGGVPGTNVMCERRRKRRQRR